MKKLWIAIVTSATFALAAAEVSWPLGAPDGKSQPAGFELKSFSGGAANVIALQDTAYRPEFDMTGKLWTFSGSFKTSASGVQYLAGTRSALGGYTGWSLLLRDGKLQLMAMADKSKGKSFQSTKTYHDGKAHRFELQYGAESVVLSVDGEIVGKIDGAFVLPENPARRFAIGSLFENSQAKLPFNGELKDFAFRSTGGAVDASKLDPELKAAAKSESGTAWQDVAAQWPQIIGGRGWADTAPYQRLPGRFKDKVRPPVWQLSTQSAGLYLHFTVDKPTPVGIRWELTSNNYLPHMSPIGVNGLDLYLKSNGKWRWVSSAKPSRSDTVNVVERFFNTAPGNEYMIYLPLYTGVKKIELALAPEAKPLPVATGKKPLVVYGTSIVHGCSASRPGMPYPAILGRKFDLPVVNLGFSGNGTLDPEFAAMLAEIPASVYILDCLPNMTSMPGDEVAKRVDGFVRELRRLAPDTPIILLEDRQYASSTKPQPHWERVRHVAEKLKQDGIAKLYYIRGETLIGDDGEATVDGSHPTDLGMMRYAEALAPVLAQALGQP